MLGKVQPLQIGAKLAFGEEGRRSHEIALISRGVPLDKKSLRFCASNRAGYKPLLSPQRDLTAAKLFLRLALSGTGGIPPRVINVGGHPAKPPATAEQK